FLSLPFCFFTFSLKKSARHWLKMPGGESQEESNVTLPLFPFSGLLGVTLPFSSMSSVTTMVAYFS
ncbi:MAG TPA: hypothetical protein VF717_07350, partial [Pyrinomonadaceae bacterium]